jgi:hypothetical protein
MIVVNSLDIAQTPLVRFVVDLLWICCTAFRLVVDKLKAVLHCFNLLCMDLSSSPQQIHNILTCRSRCCGFVEKLWICCGFVVQQVLQQIELVEFELMRPLWTVKTYVFDQRNLT